MPTTIFHRDSAMRSNVSSRKLLVTSKKYLPFTFSRKKRNESGVGKGGGRNRNKNDSEQRTFFTEQCFLSLPIKRQRTKPTSLFPLNFFLFFSLYPDIEVAKILFRRINRIFLLSSSVYIINLLSLF